MNKHKSIGLILLACVIFTGCSKTRYGQLTGVNPPGKWSESAPPGMSFIHQGSFNLGPNDQDVASLGTPSRTVSVDAFWIDDTEITNNEYRQFVYWVRDSIARKMLAPQYPEFEITQDKNGVPINPPIINWKEKIDWKDPEFQNVMQNIYIPDNERFNKKLEIDPRKLVYDYWWIDLHQAALRTNSYNYETQTYTGNVYNAEGELMPIENRSSFIMHKSEYIYPDTLVWIRDFTYSYNDPRATRYFYHPAFDDYPVVGVSWKQANAFCNWRSKYRNDYLSNHGKPEEENFRLPTEAEWEYAARGGHLSSLFPWGGYYPREGNGTFLANFKPLRGNYVADGGIETLNVRNFEPNDFGLYDMAGNVAEWTESAFDESAYNYINDLNPTLSYNARNDEPIVMKRKVVRGGSWKDVPAFLQVGTRSYEYQDSTKSYIGFRCVRSSFCDVFKGSSARKN